MASHVVPPLPGVDPEKAPTPDDPEWSEWLDHVNFTPEGVDRSLIWESLHRSPAERLLFHETLSREVDLLRRGLASARRD